MMYSHAYEGSWFQQMKMYWVIKLAAVVHCLLSVDESSHQQRQILGQEGFSLCVTLKCKFLASMMVIEPLITLNTKE